MWCTRRTSGRGVAGMGSPSRWRRGVRFILAVLWKRHQPQNCAPLQSINSSYPTQSVAVDIVGPFSNIAKGRLYVLVVADYSQATSRLTCSLLRGGSVTDLITLILVACMLFSYNLLVLNWQISQDQTVQHVSVTPVHWPMHARDHWCWVLGSSLYIWYYACIHTKYSGRLT